MSIDATTKSHPVHKSGPVYDKVWERLILKVERAEDLFGQPLKIA